MIPPEGKRHIIVKSMDGLIQIAVFFQLSTSVIARGFVGPSNRTVPAQLFLDLQAPSEAFSGSNAVTHVIF